MKLSLFQSTRSMTPATTTSTTTTTTTTMRHLQSRYCILAVLLLTSSSFVQVTDALFAIPRTGRSRGGIGNGVTVGAGMIRSTTQLDMATTSGSLGCRPIGIGSATPTTVITNHDLESIMDTSDEWISSRTGISQRHVLVGTESLQDLGIAAGRAALTMSQIDPADIDLIICATSTPDDMFGDATTIAAALQCHNAVAFDLTAACSGFLFGIVTAGQFLSNPTGNTKHALVLGADALSRWVDWDDRNTCILFGDAAGAVVLTQDTDKPGVLGYSAHSNGEGHDDLTLTYCGSPRMVATPGEGTLLSQGSYGTMHMNGREVYKFATREVPKVLTESLDAAGLTVDDVDWLLLHQANIRIMETVASRLGIPMEKVITNLCDYGNTSAASIPLALDEAVRSGKVKPGDVIACAGFGAGLSWGAAILKWG